MDNNSNFELPAASEKLSYKFIMDAMKDRLMRQSAQIDPPVATQEEVCGTQAAPVGQQIELPDLGEAPPMALETTEEPTAVPVKELSLPPGKKYFRIGEVSEVIGVEPYVLRYWENEFSTVRPVKSKSGQRVYARKDVETLHYIRHLLHVEKFSIKGAKKRLQDRRKEVQTAINPTVQKHSQNLKEMISELKELITLVRTDPGTEDIASTP